MRVLYMHKMGGGGGGGGILMSDEANERTCKSCSPIDFSFVFNLVRASSISVESIVKTCKGLNYITNRIGRTHSTTNRIN